MKTKHGRLEFLKDMTPRIEPSGRSKRMSLFRCDCGTEKSIMYDHVMSGHTKSCGCFRTELIVKRSKTHCLSGTAEHNVWKGIKKRCLNEKEESFKYYGKRGISICDRWLNSFENFYADMGKKPSALHQIDRINNNGNYEPSNCRWVTPSENSRNRRSSKRWVINGVEYQTSAEAAKFLSCSQPTIVRMCNGDKRLKIQPKPGCYSYMLNKDIHYRRKKQNELE